MTVVGVLGGGQLARMLAIAGLPLGIRLRAWDPSPEAPAAAIAEHVRADWDDPEALEHFCAGLDVATLELEGVPLGTAEGVAARVPLRPSTRALAATSDRLEEKRFATSLGIGTAPFAPVEDEASLLAALRATGAPSLLKLRRHGYDGRGNSVVRDEPSALRARLSTRYTVVNRTDRAIDSVLVNVAADVGGLAVTLDTLAFDRPTRTLATDERFGVHLLSFTRPLAPGDTARLHVVQRLAANGFPNDAPDRSLVRNGTFLNREAFPTLGYAAGAELGSDELRRKYKLPPARRSRPREDSTMHAQQVFFADADFVTFDATVSTDPDQIAMAPGYLQQEWEANGRRYFRYVMDAPIPNLFAVLSARWTVTKAMWDSTPIEVYHHPTHTFNVARMLEASRASLAFYAREFGPYQHRQLRILEFPRYAAFAQSFPNTVPYSEDIGFVARVDSTDVEDTDLPYFVTAHEIAHQWFPYQRVPANVEGAGMLSESLSEYAALVVTDRLHGRPFTQKFLRAELDRYLRGRAGETRGERPLTRVDQEPYVWYQKGSLAFFALRDLIGEAPLHAAIRAYLDEGRFAGPPYATTHDLMRHLTAATPDSLRYVLDDYFETITIWDVRTDSVTSRKRADGQYDVTIFATSRKFRADSLGTETEIPMADYVDVGVFDEAATGARLGPVMAVRKVRVRSGASRFDFVVPQAPSRAGIDPYNLLIDRNPGDNTKEIR